MLRKDSWDLWKMQGERTHRSDGVAKPALWGKIRMYKLIFVWTNSGKSNPYGFNNGYGNKKRDKKYIYN